MNDNNAAGILIALCLALAFFAWSLADWIDGQTDAWEQAAADRHYEALKRMNGDDGDSRRHVGSVGIGTTEEIR